jgi:hypothetical protein
MFDEYEFLKYCEEQYLNGLGQEDAHEQLRAGTVSETIKSMPAWILVCWLGEYQLSSRDTI